MMEEQAIKQCKNDQKTVFYFSDGTLEVANDDATEENNIVAEVNTKELPWAPWVWHYTTRAGSKSLEVCDYLGESLASFFGITTPKYQFEIDEYNRMVKEAENEKKEKDLEMGSWVVADTIGDQPATVPPQKTSDFSEENPRY